MSGISSGATCPNCGKECDVYSDYKPFEYSSISCIHCGLQIFPEIYYQSLEELNDTRRDADLPELKKLPKQDKELW